MPSSQVLGFLTVTRYICSCSCHRLSYLNIYACKPIITHKQIAINSRQRIRPTLTACSVTNVFFFSIHSYGFDYKCNVGGADACSQPIFSANAVYGCMPGGKLA